MTIPILTPLDFFNDGVDKVNDALSQLQVMAQTARGTDIDSGLSAPFPMAIAGDNQHWTKPAGVAGQYWVLDHGMVLPKSSYTDVNGQIVLAYVPATPYNIAITWSASRNGMVPPTDLSQHPTLGNRYWLLPQGHGVNVIVFDHGRVLRRDQYKVVAGVVILSYTPATVYAISAAWASGGPGITTPRTILQTDVGSLDVIHYQLPKDFGPSVLVTDHGFFLSQANYSYNPQTGVVTIIGYVPVEPLDIAASWGLRLEGIYLDSVSTTPAPNGSSTAFTLSRPPVPDTVQVSAALVDGTVVYYANYVDYDVVDRFITFKGGAVPAAGATLNVSMMCVVVDLSENVSNDESIAVSRGEVLNVSEHTTVWTTNTDGSLSEIEVKNGSDIIKTYSWNYNGDDTLASIVQAANGQTVTRTFQYDGNGEVIGTDIAVT